MSDGHNVLAAWAFVLDNVNGSTFHKDSVFYIPGTYTLQCAKQAQHLGCWTDQLWWVCECQSMEQGEGQCQKHHWPLWCHPQRQRVLAERTFAGHLCTCAGNLWAGKLKLNFKTCNDWWLLNRHQQMPDAYLHVTERLQAAQGIR